MASKPRWYFDSNAIISIIEGASPPTAAQRDALIGIEDMDIEALTSELTLAECLVKPLAEGRADLIGAFMEFLDNRDSLPTVPITRDILLLAAEIRSQAAVKLPDAIHVATARSSGCTAFISNDKGIKLPAGIARVSWTALRSSDFTI
jgi:predicted nucleic acid-binding protein